MRGNRRNRRPIAATHRRRVTLGTLTVTTLVAPFVVTGGAVRSIAATDAAALRGVVTLPDGRPGAAAVIDLNALSSGGAVAKTFKRVVADRAGIYATRITARPALRLVAERTGGRLLLRADVTDIASNGQGTPVDVFAGSVHGTSTLSQRVPASYSSVPAGRTRAAATLVDAVLSALSTIDPAVLTTVRPAGSELRLPGITGLDDLKALVDNTVVRAIGSPPNTDTWLAYVASLPEALRDALAPTLDLPAVDRVVADIEGLRVYLDDLIDHALADLSDPGRTLDGLVGTVDAILRTAADYQPFVAEAQQRIDTAVEYASTAAGQADVQARALAQLIADTATGILNEASDVQGVADVANAALGEAAGAAERTVVVLDTAFQEAMRTLQPHVSSSVHEAARLKNYDPDMLLGNDDVDDPDLVPPLGATLEIIPVTEADDADLPDGPDVLDQDGYGDAERAEADTTAGCDIIRTRISPGKGKAANPTWGVRMRVIMKVARCSAHDSDPQFDHYAIKWHGKITNYDTNGEWYTHIVRFKFRTQLNAAFERDEEDPHKDVPVDGEQEIVWTVGYSNGVAASVSGKFTAVKAKRIHPWSDYEGVLYHVSWMSNKWYGSRGADFFNGGGNTFLTPNGEKSVAIKSRNEIFIWKCWTHGSPTPYGTEGGCDPQ